MDKQTQIELFNELTKQMREILLSKGDDYAGNDRLANFKSVANITRTSPELACLNLIATKVARLSNLLTSQATPKNESIVDNIIDLSNYSILLYMIHKEST